MNFIPILISIYIVMNTYDIHVYNCNDDML